MLRIKINDSTITGATVHELRDNFARFRDDGFYGASDIGANFPVRDLRGARVGTLSYNGKYTETK